MEGPGVRTCVASVSSLPHTVIFSMLAQCVGQIVGPLMSGVSNQGARAKECLSFCKRFSKAEAHLKTEWWTNPVQAVEWGQSSQSLALNFSFLLVAVRLEACSYLQGTSVSCFVKWGE